MRARRTAEEEISPEELVRSLEFDILFGKLRPRERLVEDALIHRFKAKRHAVRQALADLERMELPGVAAENIDVSISNGTLTIKGEKRSQRQESGRTYFFTEREYGAFQRSFRLPPDVEASKIAADFKDGILTVKVPKAGAHEEKARKIEIRSA